MNDPLITVITPTIGKSGLRSLVESIANQNIPVKHILLWDSKRDDSTDKISLERAKAWETDLLPRNYFLTNIEIKDSIIAENAPGSALRSIGLMAASTQYVTFADDDIIWEPNHLSSMLDCIKDKNWIFCKRVLWEKKADSGYELIGIDNFESIGEAAKTPYKMVDNNCMMFKRRYGTSAAVLYRETKEYNDDRLMYDFLKKHAGQPEITNMATVNQVCPIKLIDFFKQNCTK